jgi:hypothetical protein
MSSLTWSIAGPILSGTATGIVGFAMGRVSGARKPRFSADTGMHARETLNAVKSVFEQVSSNKGRLNHPWAIGGTKRTETDLQNDLRAVKARIGDSKLKSEIDEASPYLREISNADRFSPIVMDLLAGPTPGTRKLQDDNKRLAQTQQAAANEGLAIIERALTRLDTLERNL